MLLLVRNILRTRFLSLIALLLVAPLAAVMVSPSQAPSQTQQPAPSTPPAASLPATSPQGGAAGSGGSPVCAQPHPARVNILVLDPDLAGTAPHPPAPPGTPPRKNPLDFVTHS